MQRLVKLFCLVAVAVTALGCENGAPPAGRIGSPAAVNGLAGGAPDPVSVVLDPERGVDRSARALSGSLCAPCVSNADCGGGNNYCLRRSDGVRFCGQDCRTSGCPSGFSCWRLTSTVSQCVPPNATCPAPDTGLRDAGPPADAAASADARPSPDADTPADASRTADAASPADGGSAVPATPYCAAVANWDPTWAEWESDVLALTNARRAQGATCGTTAYPPTAPLAMNPALRCAARLHSKDMHDRAFFSHTNPDGVTFDQRITAAGYAWTAAGENIAQGYPWPQAVVDAWMGSSGHCANIMNGQFTEIGVGYATGNEWTQDFGRPR